MAFMRSAVRSRLGPPAYAIFAKLKLATAGDPPESPEGSVGGHS